MFYDITKTNCSKPICFKVVYDVCVTPSYIDMPKEDKTDCNCRKDGNKNEFYYQKEETCNAYNKTENKNRCNCCCRRWFW